MFFKKKVRPPKIGIYYINHTYIISGHFGRFGKVIFSGSGENIEHSHIFKDLPAPTQVHSCTLQEHSVHFTIYHYLTHTPNKRIM